MAYLIGFSTISLTSGRLTCEVQADRGSGGEEGGADRAECEGWLSTRRGSLPAPVASRERSMGTGAEHGNAGRSRGEALWAREEETSGFVGS